MGRLACLVFVLAACRDKSRECAVANPDAEACLAAFQASGDPSAGARAARALADGAGSASQVAELARAIGDLPGGADAWSALGDSQLNAGEADASIDSYRRALAHRAVADLRGRTLDARGLYRAYAARNDYASAMANAALAYEWSAGAGDRGLRGRVMSGVIELLYDMGDLPAAEAMLPEAEQLVEPGTLHALSLREVRSLIDLAHGRARVAEHELRDLQTLAPAQGNEFFAEVTVSLVEAELAAGDFDAAERTLTSYPAEARARGESQQWFAHVSAKLAVARGRNDDAIAISSAALEHAPADWIGALETVRGRARWRAGRLRDAERSLVSAIEAVERRRAETALDSLKPWVLEQQRQPFEDLFRLYVDAGRTIEALAIVQRATARSILDGIASAPAPGESIAGRIDRAGDRAAGLLALAHSLSASGTTSPPDGATLVARLAGRYVVTYFRAGADVWLVALQPTGPIARRVGGVDELRRNIDAWLVDPERRDVAEALARALLPDDLRPPPKTTIYIAADAPVRDVSFAALPVDGAQLVRRNPIAYVPAASIPPRAPTSTGPTIVLGDPSGDLPGARREAREVAQVLGANASIGRDATRAQLEVRGARLIHVAGHTTQTARGPALVLADGRLDSGEILERRLAADVVVLTSCAAADPRDRDELAPLANAFLAAGARAVVASRWSVGDDIAARFTRAFYAAGGAKDPIGATATAERQLIADGFASRDWSTFVVIAAPPTSGANE